MVSHYKVILFNQECYQFILKSYKATFVRYNDCTYYISPKSSKFYIFHKHPISSAGNTQESLQMQMLYTNLPLQTLTNRTLGFC